MTWMLYGANGYTGRLVAELALATGERPVLAGRSGQVAELAAGLGLASVVVDVGDGAGLRGALDGVDAVLHCAGPFSATSAPVVAACLATGTSYADLTGEIDVFEAVYAEHDAARQAGVSLVSGVGFDVVPTDTLLARLHARLPEATWADVVLLSRGGFSAGTLRTVVEGMRDGNVVRADGRLTTVPHGHRSRVVWLDGQRSVAHSTPLGDVASGFRTTGIPDITNFAPVPMGSVLPTVDPVFRRLLRSDAVHGWVDRTLQRAVKGPSTDRREASRSDVWVEVGAPDGRTVSAAIRVANTYAFTAASALHAIRRVVAGDVAPGAWSPTQAFGPDFIDEIPGTTVVPLSTRPG